MGIDAAVEDAVSWMDQFDEVLGVAQGACESGDCISVYVNDMKIASKLPTSLHGFPVICIQSDEFVHQ